RNAFGERDREVRASQREFGESSVDGVAGERWLVAQVLLISTAIVARSIHPGHPGHAHPRALGKIAFDHLAHNLMTWGHSIPHGLQLAFDDVKIGPAHAA